MLSVIFTLAISGSPFSTLSVSMGGMTSTHLKNSRSSNTMSGEVGTCTEDLPGALGEAMKVTLYSPPAKSSGAVDRTIRAVSHILYTLHVRVRVRM